MKSEVHIKIFLQMKDSLFTFFSDEFDLTIVLLLLKVGTKLISFFIHPKSASSFW